MHHLEFVIADLPPGKPGIFSYGPFQNHLPYGNGWVCIGGPLQRVSITQWANQAGVVTYPVNLAEPPYSAGANQIVPGSTWNFQFWYRDPGGGLSGFNFSNAVQIVFAP